MTVLRNILKWTGIAIATLLLLLILAGLTTRLCSPTPQPPGQLIDVGGLQLHINSSGPHNDKPTLVIVAGAGAPGEYYHWINEGLKDSIRVVRYDRAGIGYSDLADSPRHPETEAHELHRLLKRSGERPPYILAGHSYGGHHIRIFAKLYPDEIAALVFLDSSHPEMDERIGFPDQPWFIDPLYEIGTVAGDMGLIRLFEQMTRPILWAPGLPEDQIDRMRDYTYSGKFIKGYLRGDDQWSDTLLNLASATRDFGNLPIQVFSGTKQHDAALQSIGIDPEHFRIQRRKMQQEIAELSTDHELFFMDEGHVTIFTLPEQAEFINQHILQLVDRIDQSVSKT